MIFVAITVALVAIVWLFQGEILDEAPKKLTPYIGMMQEDDHILITNIRNGPIPTTSVYIEIINKSTGESEGEAHINDNGDGDINTGDSIMLTGITKGVYTL